VVAADPTASDTLVYNARPGAGSENVRLAPTALAAGVLTTNAPITPPITFTGVEHLDVVLQPGEGDVFAVDGTLANDHVIVTSGLEIGHLHVEGTMGDGGIGPFALPSIDVRNLPASGSFGLFNAFNFGGVDTLEIVGTSGNDEFALTGTGALVHSVNGVPTNRIGFVNFADVTVESLDGDDTFSVEADPSYNLHLHGGNPSASDTAFFATPTGTVTVNLANLVAGADTSVTGFGAGTVTLSGIEIANIDTDDELLNFVGTSGPDEISYTRPRARIQVLSRKPASIPSSISRASTIRWASTRKAAPTVSSSWAQAVTTRSPSRKAPAL
jgi:hypothetical protein